jgi:hypothetical protein
MRALGPTPSSDNVSRVSQLAGGKTAVLLGTARPSLAFFPNGAKSKLSLSDNLCEIKSKINFSWAPY